VWVPDAEEGFVRGTVVDIGLGELTVDVPNKKNKITAPLERTYPAHDYDDKIVDDNCKSNPVSHKFDVQF